MMYAIMFFICIVSVLIWRYLDKPYRTNKSELMNGFTLGFYFAMMLAFFIYGISGYSPSAQDVVDGKTTFIVTYIDNVPTDSVLVYKNEYKHINWW